jgi:protein-histidine pros-kinase
MAAIFAAFRDEAPRLVARLAEALATGDPARAGRVAHQLRGTSLGLGALRLAHHATALEQAARAGDAAQVAALGAAVAPLIDATLADLARPD